MEEDENARLYKEKTKNWHDNHKRSFQVGDWVILFNSRLKLFSRKLRTRRNESYQVQKVFNHDAVEIWSEKTGAFKVKGQRLKHYAHGEPIGEMMDVSFTNAPD